MSARLAPHTLIRASAGTGKTYQLTNRYIELLQHGEPVDEILAVTFTRKAAGEIFQRILQRLALAAENPRELSNLNGGLVGTPLTRDACLALLADVTRQLHRLRIGTLDSFFAQVAGSHALELDLPPGWRIVDEHEDAALRSQALVAMMDQATSSEVLTLVHAMTRGDTTRSVQKELHDKVEGFYGVYRESSREAWFRIPRLPLLEEAMRLQALEDLRRVAMPDLPSWQDVRDGDAEVAASEDWESFLRSGLAAKIAADEPKYRNRPIEPAIRAAYQPLVKHAQAVLLHQLANQTEATWNLLDLFHHHYQLGKQQTGGLRFDDVTHRLASRLGDDTPSDPSTSLILHDAPASSTSDLPDFAFRLDARLRHILLDEFQDTSLSQWSVLRPFVRNLMDAPARDSKASTMPRRTPPSLFCVGDTKQAIYGWRGGEAEVFNAVQRETPDLVQQPLDTSWRSSPVVIAVVNQVFQNLHHHTNLGAAEPAVLRWQQQFKDHQSAEPLLHLSGYVCLQAAPASADASVESQRDVTLRFVAAKVAALHQRAPNKTVGVLVRTNDEVRRTISELRESGIEASEEGGCRLDDAAVVQLAQSFLQLADHPQDLVARFHIATSPLATWVDTWPAPKDEFPSTPAATTERQAIQFSSPLGNGRAGRLASRIRERLASQGYGKTLDAFARQAAPYCSPREARRLEKLIGLAFQYDAVSSGRPSDFLAFVESAKVRDPQAAAVRVMTIHQAKGLEFDLVVVTGLERDLAGQGPEIIVGRPAPTAAIDRVCRSCGAAVRQCLPSSWQQMFQDAQDQRVTEELCVLYVAMTRAIQALHLIVAPSAKNEKTLPRKVSGLLRAALVRGRQLQPEEVAYEHGDPQWHEGPAVAPDWVPGPAVQSGPIMPVPRDGSTRGPAFAGTSGRRWRSLERVSPSGLEGGRHVRLTISEGVGDERQAALRRGLLLHAFFERIKWLEDGTPTDAQLLEIAANLPDTVVSPGELETVVARFRVILDEPRIASLLCRSEYTTWSDCELRVETERPFAIRHGDRLLVGSLDRVVTASRQGRAVFADVIDYKTDQVAAEDQAGRAERVAFYRPQLQAYRLAIGQIHELPLESVSCRLVFLAAGSVEPCL